KLNLELSAPENVKIISEFGDIEIETAINGQLTGPVWQPILNGRVDLLQGEFSLFAVDQPFKILSGSYIENNSSQFVFNPKYTILSETTQPIRNVDLITVDGQIRNRDLVIRANLNGYLNEKHNPVLSAEVLEKEVGEEYRLEQKQILSILTLGMIDPSTLQTAAFGSTDTLSRTQDQLSPMVSSFVLQQSQRYFGGRLAQLMGFRQTRFDLNPNEFESSRFLLTKEISNRLALTYSSTFQLHSEPRIEIEYELGKNFAIKGERDQGKFGVDLKIEKRF
ncbi:translocation/assembly module TamB, partial [Candidatus Poribacteria bacterium]|nr:translocation/assembly module TamB [Candidatus Poribacteria bacterium]